MAREWNFGKRELLTRAYGPELRVSAGSGGRWWGRDCQGGGLRDPLCFLLLFAVNLKLLKKQSLVFKKEREFKHKEKLRERFSTKPVASRHRPQTLCSLRQVGGRITWLTSRKAHNWGSRPRLPRALACVHRYVRAFSPEIWAGLSGAPSISRSLCLWEFTWLFPSYSHPSNFA